MELFITLQADADVHLDHHFVSRIYHLVSASALKRRNFAVTKN